MLYFGIPVRVSFSPNNDTLAKEIWTYLRRVDDVFNDYRPDSEISRLNAGEAANSAELIAALRTSQKAHQACGGAFDITVRPLRELWRQAEKAGVLPTNAEIAAALTRCGMRRITVTDDSISLADGVTVDLGGIIKGIAIDHVSAPGGIGAAVGSGAGSGDGFLAFDQRQLSAAHRDRWREILPYIRSTHGKTRAEWSAVGEHSRAEAGAELA
jgi:hypothetical protein